MKETRIVAYSPENEEGVTLIGNTDNLAVCIKALVDIGYNKFKMVPNLDE